MSFLDNKFVHHDLGDGYRTGQIVYVIRSFVLIQFDSMTGSDAIMPMELVRLEEISDPGREPGPRRWCLFNSRADMGSWIARIDALEEPQPDQPGGRMN